MPRRPRLLCVRVCVHLMDEVKCRAIGTKPLLLGRHPRVRLNKINATTRFRLYAKPLVRAHLSRPGPISRYFLKAPTGIEPMFGRRVMSIFAFVARVLSISIFPLGQLPLNSVLPCPRL